MSLGFRSWRATVALAFAFGCSNGSNEPRDDPLPAMCDWPEGKCALQGLVIEDAREATDISLSLSSSFGSKACGDGAVVEVQIGHQDPDWLELNAFWDNQTDASICDSAVLRAYVWRYVDGAWEEKPNVAFDVTGTFDPEALGIGLCILTARGADGPTRSGFAYDSLIDIRNTSKIRLALFAADGCKPLSFQFHLSAHPEPTGCDALWETLGQCGWENGTCYPGDDCVHECEADASCDELEADRAGVEARCRESCDEGAGGVGGAK